MTHSSAACLLILALTACSGEPDLAEPAPTAVAKQSLAAIDVTYDRGTSALAAATVQAAVDEVDLRLDAVEARAPIPGPRGEAGPPGAAGPAGANGLDGLDGTDGTDGTNGTNGTNGLDGADGLDGAPGEPGLPGDPGQSVTSEEVPVGDATCPHGGARFTAVSGITHACNAPPSSIAIGSMHAVMLVPAAGTHHLFSEQRFTATHDGACVVTAKVVTQASQGGYTMTWAAARDRWDGTITNSVPREWMRPGTDPTASYGGDTTQVFAVTAGRGYSFGCGVELSPTSGMIGYDFYCYVTYLCN